MLARFGNYLYLCGIALAHERFQRADASGRRAVLFYEKDVFERLSLCITNFANP